MVIDRKTVTYKGIVVDTPGGGTSQEINCDGFTSGGFRVSVSGPTTITWYAAIESASGPSGGTVTPVFEPAYDGAGTPAAVTQAVTTSRWYQLPTALAGASAIKAVASAGTIGKIDVCLKA